jgi:hypothetical protein
LPFHTADHVEGSFGFAAQRHFQQVFFDARFHGFAQLSGDFEVTVRRAEAFDALMRPFVVVIFDPEANPVTGRLEAFKLGAREELLPDGFPEALDFAQGHGMMGSGFEVMGPVLFHLGLEPGGAAPVHVLPAIVGEHLLGRLILRGGDAKHLQHVLGGMAAEQIGSDHETGVIVHEADQVSVAAPEPEGEDVSLPHLVRSGPLEEPRTHQVLSWFGRCLHQALRLQSLADCLRAGLQEEHSLEQLGDALDAAGRLLLLELQYLIAHWFGQLPRRSVMDPGLQAFLTFPAVTLHPFAYGGKTNPDFLGHHLLGEAFLQVEFDGAQSFFIGARQTFSRSPPRGGCVVLLLCYWFILLHVTLLSH